MSATLRQGLPAVYAPLLPAFFDTPAPEETKATCSACAMCPKDGAPDEGVVYFRPDTKCCTYFPRLPGYLVGAILRDGEMAEGQRRIRARIAGRVGVTPRWLAPSRKYSLLFEASRESSFGRSRSMLCPYYDDGGGLCTIWKHRESTCSTFFCKYVAGADGRAFWRSLDTYLRRLEARLSEHALRALAPDLVEPALPNGRLTLDELEDRPPSAYADVWGAWAGREEELYVGAYEIVAALDREAFERVTHAGEELAAMEAALRCALAPELPERLVLSPHAPPVHLADGVLVDTFSTHEPVKVTPDLFEVLRAFGSGETVAEVRARLFREHEVELPDDMLIALYQLRVLVPA
jgi:Fe-S-cluster containining protein